MSTPTETIIPEIDEIVNFFTPELVEQIAKDLCFVQRESTLGGIEFLGLMTYGLFSQPDARTRCQQCLKTSINSWK